MQQVLTIAGSDILAGGGLQADLKTFEELETFGLSVVTCIASISGINQVTIDDVPPAVVSRQLDAIVKQTHPAAIKVGLVHQVAVLDLLADFLTHQTVPIVLDPVLIFKETDQVFQQDYLTKLKTLLPLATIVTPNLIEAQQLTNQPTIKTQLDLQDTAKHLQQLGVQNVVIKGGARYSPKIALDYVQFGDQTHLLKTPLLKEKSTDGAGCTFSAVITAQLAKGATPLQAVKFAKEFVYAGIGNNVQLSADFSSVWQGAWRAQGGQSHD